MGRRRSRIKEKLKGLSGWDGIESPFHSPPSASESPIFGPGTEKNSGDVDDPTSEETEGQTSPSRAAEGCGTSSEGANNCGSSRATAQSREAMVVDFNPQEGNDHVGLDETTVGNEEGRFSSPMSAMSHNTVERKISNEIKQRSNYVDEEDDCVEVPSLPEREAVVVDFSKPSQEDDEEKGRSIIKNDARSKLRKGNLLAAANKSKRSRRTVSFMLSHIPTIDENTSLNMSASSDNDDSIYDEEEDLMFISEGERLLLKFEQHLRRIMNGDDWTPRIRRRSSDSALLKIISISATSSRAGDGRGNDSRRFSIATLGSVQVDEARMHWRNDMLSDLYLEQDMVEGFQLLNRPESSFENPLHQPAPDWNEGRVVSTLSTGNRPHTPDDDDMTVMTTATVSTVSSVLTISSVMSAWSFGRTIKKTERVGRRFLDLTVDATEEEWYESSDYMGESNHNGEDDHDDMSIISTYSISFRKKKSKKQQEQKRSRSIARNFLDLTVEVDSNDSGSSSLTRRATFGALFGGTARSSESKSLLYLKDFEDLDLSQSSDNNLMDFRQDGKDEKATNGSTDGKEPKDAKNEAGNTTGRKTLEDKAAHDQSVEPSNSSFDSSTSQLSSDGSLDFHASTAWEKADEFLIMEVHEVARNLERKLVAKGHPSPFWDYSEIMPSFRDFHTKVKAKEETCRREHAEAKARREEKEQQCGDKPTEKPSVGRGSAFFSFGKTAKSGSKTPGKTMERRRTWDDSTDDLGGLDNLGRFRFRNDEDFFRNYTYGKRTDDSYTLPNVLAKGLEKRLSDDATICAMGIIEDITNPLRPHREQTVACFDGGKARRRPSLLQSMSLNRFFGTSSSHIRSTPYHYDVRFSDIESTNERSEEEVPSNVDQGRGDDGFFQTAPRAFMGSIFKGADTESSHKFEARIESMEKELGELSHESWPFHTLAAGAGSEDDLSQITMTTLKSANLPPGELSSVRAFVESARDSAAFH